MLGFGVFEIIFLILLVFALIWVYFDAPKYGMKRLPVILGIIFLAFPISFVLYLFITRNLKFKEKV